MLIASRDIETTGLDPEYCQVLEVGVVLWETSDLDTPVTACRRSIATSCTSGPSVSPSPWP